jgi:multidrug efflux pump subunit AcrA (membrane-fusion protein)
LRRIDQDLRSIKAVKFNRITWVGLGLLIAIVGVVIFLAFSPTSGGSDQVDENESQSVVARSGDLTISVSGSGELVPLSETSLSFEDNGELVALNVGVGDQIQAGDVLASLKLDRTESDLAADLANAELDILLAQQKIEHTYENAQLEAAKDLLALEEAQLAVETLQNYELEQALALQNLSFAESAVQDAEMDLYIVNSAPSQQALNTASASLLFKEKELHEIQEQIERAEYQFISAPNQMVRDRLDQQLTNLRLQLANQQIEYENALYKSETLDNPPEEIDLTLAEARLATAQAQLAEAESNWAEVQNGPPAGDLAIAEARLAEAQSEWARLNAGPDPDELALLEAGLAKAELKLQILQDESLVLDLVAPVDRTVLMIDAGVGDRVGNQAILTIADLSQAMIAVSVDEIEQASVRVGNRVEISFDALPEQIFQGEVVQINPSLIEAGNSQAFRVWVLLDALPNDLIKLPLGINAVVDVITGEVQNSVLVTIEALHEDLNGGYSVYVIEGETMEQRPVQVGLMDATSAEIVMGLQPGEQVAIGNLNIDRE